MHEERKRLPHPFTPHCPLITLSDPHPLLVQLPLTVSPFLSLPTATPLPYTYKTLPSTLPPSCIDSPDPHASPNQKPAYVLSASGDHAAHPDDIIASCQALQQHLQKMTQEARETVRKWQDGIKERELAEKRRVAPGWLDAEEKMLVPERRTGAAGATQQESARKGGVVNSGQSGDMEMSDGRKRDTVGEELDRAFGGMGLA